MAANSKRILECPADEEDAKFDMQLEINQLQMKVRLLAGGTDGEQLAQVLLDREEELRQKDSIIIDLNNQLDGFESDRAEYVGMIGELDSQLTASKKRVNEMAQTEANYSKTLDELKTKCSNQESQLKTMEDKLSTAASSRSEMAQRLNSMTMSSQTTHAANKVKIQELEQQIKNLKASEEVLKLDAVHFEQRKQDIIARSRALKQELMDQLSKEKEEHSITLNKNEALSAELTQLKANWEESQAKLKETEEVLKSSNSRLSEFEFRAIVQEEKLNQSQSHIEQLAGSKIELERLLNAKRIEFDELERAQQHSLSEVQEIKQVNSTLDKKVTELSNELSTVQGLLHTAQEALSKAKQEINNLEVTSQQQSQAYAIDVLNLNGTICDLKEKHSSLETEFKLKVSKLTLDNKQLRAKVIRQDEGWRGALKDKKKHHDRSSMEGRKSANVARRTDFSAGRSILQDIKNIEEDNKIWA